MLSGSRVTQLGRDVVMNRCKMVRIALKNMSIRASSGTAVSDGVVEHRDVFIFDTSWPLKKWANTMSTPPRFNRKNSNQNSDGR